MHSDEIEVISNNAHCPHCGYNFTAKKIVPAHLADQPQRVFCHRCGDFFQMKFDKGTTASGTALPGTALDQGGSTPYPYGYPDAPSPPPGAPPPQNIFLGQQSPVQPGKSGTLPSAPFTPQPFSPALQLWLRNPKLRRNGLLSSCLK